MTGTLVVLAISLCILLLVTILALVAFSFLAKRFGLVLKSLSVSFTHGITAEFVPKGEPQSGNN